MRELIGKIAWVGLGGMVMLLIFGLSIVLRMIWDYAQ